MPKLGPWKERIRARMAGLLGIPVRRVNVKAKTMEGLGEIGRKRAIAAWVVVSLNRVGRRRNRI